MLYRMWTCRGHFKSTDTDTELQTILRFTHHSKNWIRFLVVRDVLYYSFQKSLIVILIQDRIISTVFLEMECT